MRSKKLNEAFTDFIYAMKRRLNKKEHKGFYGWDDRYNFDGMKEQASKKLNNPESDAEDFVDVANFAMFLAYQKNKRIHS